MALHCLIKTLPWPRQRKGLKSVQVLPVKDVHAKMNCGEPTWNCKCIIFEHSGCLPHLEKMGVLDAEILSGYGDFLGLRHGFPCQVLVCS